MAMWRIQAIHFSFLENSSTFFFGSEEIWFNQVGFSEFFLGGFKTRNLTHPSPSVGVFPSQWVGRESIIHGTPPKVRELSSVLVNVSTTSPSPSIPSWTLRMRSYPVSSSTPERGLSEMMHTVEKTAIINPQNMECRCCTKLMAEQSTMNAPAKTF